MTARHLHNMLRELERVARLHSELRLLPARVDLSSGGGRAAEAEKL